MLRQVEANYLKTLFILSGSNCKRVTKPIN